MSLQSLPAPGLAIFPEWQSQKETHVRLSCSSYSTKWEVHRSDGLQLFAIDCSNWTSKSGRKEIIDGSGKTLGYVRRQCWSMKYKYYFQTVNSEEHVWDFTSKGLSGRRNEVTLRNAADDGREEVLDFKDQKSLKTSCLNWRDRPVALAITEKSWKGIKNIDISIATGVDIVLALTLYMALRDMRESQLNANVVAVIT